jgi:hypothetical protein
MPDLSLLLPLLEEVIAILKRSTGSSGRHATIRVGGGWHMTVLEVVMGSMVPFTGGGGWDRHKKDYEEREREREREREGYQVVVDPGSHSSAAVDPGLRSGGGDTHP